MRTEPQPTAVTRLRTRLGAAGRWLGGRGRSARILILTAVIACGGGLVYFTLPETEQPEWLYAGRKFSEDAGRSIQAALAAEDIAVYSDREGRLGVKPSSWSKALEVLRKKKVEPPSLEEIEKDYQTPNLWETREQREQRLHWGLERKLEVMISQLDDIRSADVTIHREQVRWGMRPEWKLSGFVYIEPVPNREVGPRSIRAIQGYLVSQSAGLKGEAVTISDRAGKFYLVAGEPNGGFHSKGQARAEELRESVLARLRFIKGVDVLVQMEEPAVEASNAPAVSANTRAPLKSNNPTETALNQPIELDAEPTHAPAASEAKPVTPPPIPKAKILVQVPRSHYLDAYRENTPNRNPAPEDLTPYIIRTETLIRNAVSLLVPASELDVVKIDTIPDAPIAPRVVATPGSNAHDSKLQSLPNWLPGAAAGACVGLAVATLAGFGIRAARGPRKKARSNVGRGGVTVDPPGVAVPGPSERVRELVRANPRAAAGVLHRWIGEEGGAS